MKKTIAISFLFFFPCANTELHQLLKLPALLHHFTDHKESDHAISFLDFVKKHYGEEDSPAHNHKNDHEKLPFKSGDCSPAHTFAAFYVPVGITFNNHIPVLLKGGVVYSENYFSSATLSIIWQPPKTA